MSDSDSSWQAAYAAVATLGCVLATIVFLTPGQMIFDVYRRRKVRAKEGINSTINTDSLDKNNDKLVDNIVDNISTNVNNNTAVDANGKSVDESHVAGEHTKHLDANPPETEDPTETDPTDPTGPKPSNRLNKTSTSSEPIELELPPLAITAQTTQSWLWLVFGIGIQDVAVISANVIGLVTGICYCILYPWFWKTVSVSALGGGQGEGGCREGAGASEVGGGECGRGERSSTGNANGENAGENHLQNAVGEKPQPGAMSHNANTYRHNDNAIAYQNSNRRPIYRTQFLCQLGVFVILFLGSSSLFFLDREGSVIVAEMAEESGSDGSSSRYEPGLLLIYLNLTITNSSRYEPGL
jgi:hypothetical protein